MRKGVASTGAKMGSIGELAVEIASVGGERGGKKKSCYIYGEQTDAEREMRSSMAVVSKESRDIGGKEKQNGVINGVLLAGATQGKRKEKGESAVQGTEGGGKIPLRRKGREEK